MTGEIDYNRYYSTTESLKPGENDMNRQIRRVIRPGVKFRHEVERIRFFLWSTYHGWECAGIQVKK